jgi:prevent-host-death family protein
MGSKRTKGVQEARQELPALIEAAHRGSGTIITKHGKPYAAIVPVGDAIMKGRGVTMAQLRGTGKKIWKKDAAREVSKLRDEWR